MSHSFVGSSRSGGPTASAESHHVSGSGRQRDSPMSGRPAAALPPRTCWNAFRDCDGAREDAGRRTLLRLREAPAGIERSDAAGPPLERRVARRWSNARVEGLLRGHSFASERSGSDAIHSCLRRTLLQLRLVGIA